MSVIPRPHRPQGWLLVIALELITILVVLGLVVASIYLRNYQHKVCVNQRNAFAYVHTLNGQRIESLRTSIKLDRKAGRNLKVTAGKKSLQGALELQDAVAPPSC